MNRGLVLVGFTALPTTNAGERDSGHARHISKQCDIYKGANVVH